MELRNTYYYFKSALDPETCAKIIKLGTDKIAANKAAGLSTEAYTFGDTQKSKMGADAQPQGELAKDELKKLGVDTKSLYVRDSEVAWLEDSWLYELFQPFVHRANKEAGWNWDWDYSESFQFTVYNPSQFYSWHKDGDSDIHGIYRRYIHGVTQVPLKEDGSLPSKYTTNSNMVGKVRKISMTCNLNLPGEYDGGNLKFDWGSHTDGDRYHECEEIRPQGSIILFPGFVSHCVTPVTRGTRYSLVLWSLGKPWK
jgi:PKHD-type hydroxylase